MSWRQTAHVYGEFRLGEEWERVGLWWGRRKHRLLAVRGVRRRQCEFVLQIECDALDCANVVLGTIRKAVSFGACATLMSVRRAHSQSASCDCQSLVGCAVSSHFGARAGARNTRVLRGDRVHDMFVNSPVDICELPRIKIMRNWERISNRFRKCE